jgi:hypothetical protein
LARYNKNNQRLSRRSLDQKPIGRGAGWSNITPNCCMNSFLDNLSQLFQREHLVSPTMNHSMAVRAHNSHIGPGIDFRFLSQGAHRVQVRASSKPPQRSLKPQNWFLGTAGRARALRSGSWPGSGSGRLATPHRGRPIAVEGAYPEVAFAGPRPRRIRGRLGALV